MAETEGVVERKLSELLDRAVLRPLTGDPIAYLERTVRSLRELYDAHFKARDEAVRLLHDDMVRVPTLLDRARHEIKETLGGRITSSEALRDEKLSAVNLRFIEMEKRTKDLDEARALALAAALQAAKEAVAEQNRSNTTAIAKSESAVGEQLKQLQVNFQAANQATNEKIDDLKSRLDRGEGSQGGQQAGRTEHRLDTSMIISGVMLLVALAALFIKFGH